MKPAGSTGALVNYGNATSPFNGAPFAITEQISRNGPTMGAPNLTGRAPRLPLIEKITPRRVYASRDISTTRARIRTRVQTTSRRAIQNATAYAHAIRMRQRGSGKFFQRISTPLISK